MFKKVMEFLDKPYKDEIYESLSNNKKFNQTLTWFGLAYIFFILLILFLLFFFVSNKDYKYPIVYQINEKVNEANNNPLILLNEARVTHKSIINWTTDAVNSIYNLDFLEYEKQLTLSKKYFTDEGYRKFEDNLIQNKVIDKIIEEKKIVKMVVSGTPIIVSENIYGSQDIMGNKYWQMRVPVIVTTESGRTEVASGYVNLMIVFQATDDNPSGFYISQIVSEF